MVQADGRSSENNHPLIKPIIIYTMLISFISPSGDYIFARVIMGDKYDNYTVAIGLFEMLNRKIFQPGIHDLRQGLYLYQYQSLSCSSSCKNTMSKDCPGLLRGS